MPQDFQETARLKWKFQVKDSRGSFDAHSSPTVADSVVYINCGHNDLCAIDAKNGREKWPFNTGSKILSSPAVADDVVYVGSDDGYLYAIERTTQ